MAEKKDVSKVERRADDSVEKTVDVMVAAVVVRMVVGMERY